MVDVGEVGSCQRSYKQVGNSVGKQVTAVDQDRKARMNKGRDLMEELLARRHERELLHLAPICLTLERGSKVIGEARIVLFRVLPHRNDRIPEPVKELFEDIVSHLEREGEKVWLHALEANRLKCGVSDE